MPPRTILRFAHPALYSFFASLCSFFAVAAAQDLPVFRSDSTVVVVPVTVTDRLGRFVPGLTRDQFEISDGESRRVITQFSAERVPISLGILLDISGSMTTDPNAVAALKLLVTRLAPHDEVFFAVFNEKVSLAVPWTEDHARVWRAVHSLKPGGTTSLLDAVKLTAPAFRIARYPRKVLLLISDGNDTRLPPAPLSNRDSGASPETLRRAETAEKQKQLRELMIGGATDAIAKSEAALYAIGLGPDPQLMNLPLLQTLTADSGGYVELPNGLADLSAAVARVCDELQSQYLLGFEPTRADGQMHPIKVTVKKSGVNVRARAGYVAK
jgi:Ca-activated chloride channel family protein